MSYHAEVIFTLVVRTTLERTFTLATSDEPIMFRARNVYRGQQRPAIVRSASITTASARCVRSTTRRQHLLSDVGT